MSENKIEISIKDIEEVIEELKYLEEEVDFERKSKNLFIDDLYKVCDMSLKQEKEIERLHSIIKEVREYIENNKSGFQNNLLSDVEFNANYILEILDKVD